jgi:hypothetical protein
MMRSAFRPATGIFLACISLLALPCPLFSQQDAAGAMIAAPVGLPEAPLPQTAPPVDPASDQQTQAQQTQPAQQPTVPVSNPAPAPAQSSSSSQTAAPQSDAEKSQREKAEEQLKAQEHQRVMGVMATFNTTTDKDALPLSSKQKFHLFFKSSTDPWPFLLAGVVSGIGQADNSYPEWGQGAQGYAKRYGAAYSDAFIGNFFGNAVLPSLLKEDPRYFQKGTGSFTRRALWAASSTFWCKRDNGKWGPNYANVGGNLISAAIARAYYPASERTVGDTITDGLTVSVEGIAGAEVIEFWPDIARHSKRKHDEKLARQAAQRDAQGGAPDSAQKSAAQKSKDETQQNQEPKPQ